MATTKELETRLDRIESLIVAMAEQRVVSAAAKPKPNNSLAVGVRLLNDREAAKYGKDVDIFKSDTSGKAVKHFLVTRADALAIAEAITDL
jgi:hypothetical protein